MRPAVLQITNEQVQVDLARAINTHHPGDVLSVSVVRADQQLTLNLTLTERPA